MPPRTAAIAFTLYLLAPSIALGQIPPPTPTTIDACLNPGNGSLRVIAEDQACRPNETRLRFNTAGPQGPKGDTGPQGPIGPQGPKGDTGLQGARGPQGDQGPQGVAGPQGAQGLKGDPGEAGAKGDKGDTGAQGPKGDTGLQGAKGDTGAQGLAGDPGPEGPAGPAGPTGSPGEKGDTGPKGDPGTAGPKGDPGDAGPPGPKGDPGEAGAAATVRSATTAECASGGVVVIAGDGVASQPVCNGAQGPPGPATIAVSEDEAMGYASNIVVTIQNFGGAFTPLGISRVGVNVDIVETTTGDVEYRSYRPGNVQYPDITLLVPPDHLGHARDWFGQAVAGEDARRTVTIHVIDPAQQIAVIRVDLSDCFPRSYDESAGLLVLKVGGMDVAGSGVKGASVIDNPAPTTHDYVVGDWVDPHSLSQATMVRGGAVSIEFVESPYGTEPGKKTVSPLAARIDWPSPSIYLWINETIDGRDRPRTLAVTPVGSTTTTSFEEPFPIRFSAINPLLIMPGNLMPATIDLTVKANRKY